VSAASAPPSLPLYCTLLQPPQLLVLVLRLRLLLLPDYCC
jgi:hypothetical protein